MPHDVHEFEAQKRFAEDVRHEPFWNDIYKRAFPDMVSCTLNPRNNGAQRAGIDRSILLKSTKVLRIDEKLRKEERRDILLEYLSNDRTDAPGWMEKDLMIDYMAYAMLPAQRCYLFPWDMLRRAWLAHKHDWITRGKERLDGFRAIVAENRGYNTHSVCVPLEVLRSTVNRASVIQLEGCPPAPGLATSPGLRPLTFARQNRQLDFLNELAPVRKRRW